MPQAASAVQKMRPQQLHDIARAWEIPVENGGTKPDILPALMAAERNGVFKSPPKHPEYARRASRNSDEPPLAPLVESPNYRGMALAELSRACVSKGIDTHRRGGDWMINELEASHGLGTTPA